jgi:hypothetical protein
MGAVPIFSCPGTFDSFALAAAIVSSRNRTSPQGPGVRCATEFQRTVRFDRALFSQPNRAREASSLLSAFPVNFARRTRQCLALEVTVIARIRTALSNAKSSSTQIGSRRVPSAAELTEGVACWSPDWAVL